VAAEAKRQVREQRNAERVAKESRERPLLERLLLLKKLPTTATVKDLKLPFLKSLLAKYYLDTRCTTNRAQLSGRTSPSPAGG